jgi:hypothetical protein
MGKQIPIWNYPNEHKLWNLKLSSLNQLHMDDRRFGGGGGE